MDFLEALFSDMTAFQLSSVGVPVVLLIVYLCCMLDALVPPVPSESVVIAVATLTMTQSTMPLWLLLAVAALGAWTGDNGVYQIGRTVGNDRWSWMRRPRVAAAIGTAGRLLESRGSTFIITGRFIPVGRVAVNLAAGSTRYPRAMFVANSAVAAIVWASFSVGIGMVFGHLFHDQPVIAAAIGVGAGLAIGLAIDFAATKIGRFRAARALTRGVALEDSPTRP